MIASEDSLFWSKCPDIVVSFQGFQNKTVFETSLQADELNNLIEEVQLDFSTLSF